MLVQSYIDPFTYNGNLFCTPSFPMAFAQDPFAHPFFSRQIVIQQPAHPIIFVFNVQGANQNKQIEKSLSTPEGPKVELIESTPLVKKAEKVEEATKKETSKLPNNSQSESTQLAKKEPSKLWTLAKIGVALGAIYLATEHLLPLLPYMNQKIATMCPMSQPALPMPSGFTQYYESAFTSVKRASTCLYQKYTTSTDFESFLCGYLVNCKTLDRLRRS